MVWRVTLVCAYVILLFSVSAYCYAVPKTAGVPFYKLLFAI